MFPLGSTMRLGIDLGVKSVKLCALSVRRSGLEISTVSAVESQRFEASGLEELAEAVARFVHSENLPTSDATLVLPASSAMLRYVTVPPAPDWRIDLLAGYEVEEVARRMGEPVCAGWRAEPFPNPSGERPLLLALAKEEELSAIISAFGRGGLRITGAVPTAEALWRAWENFLEPGPGEGVTLLLEIGARYAHVIVSVEGRMLFTRQAQVGGDSFNQALSEKFKASPEELELLKLRSTGLIEEGSKRDFSSLFRRPAGQLVNLVRGALSWSKGFLKEEPFEVKYMVLTGGGARLKGLQRYMERTLGVPVVCARWAGPPCGEGTEELPFGFLPAVGAASISPDSAGTLEVLPHAVKERRKFWREKVYLYAAVGLLGVFLILQFLVGLNRAAARSRLIARLKQIETQLQGDSARYDQAMKLLQSLQRRRAVLEAAVSRTGFYGELLAYLGQKLDPGIYLVSLEKVQLERDELAPAVELEGLADNADRRAVALVQELQQDLGKQAFVGSVKLLSEFWRLEARKNAYRFRLRIRAPSESGSGKAEK